MNKHLEIGGVSVPNKTVLAPMAGITDLAFRLICREYGAGLVYTEMISAKGIIYNNENTKSLLMSDIGEKPAAVQLFGSEPEVLAEAADIISDEPFDFLDLNFGCPAPKIVKNGEGSALMQNPKRIYEIVSATVKRAKKPVTVKIRKGFDLNSVNAVLVAKEAEAAGAAAVCVHPRTRTEYYAGHSDWDIIRQVKEAVKIPVIGSGDVTDGKKAVKMLNETGCDFIMVGRGAQGNPWIFEEILAELNNVPVPTPPSVQEKINRALSHAALHVGFKSERAVVEMRKHICWYLKGVRGASSVKEKINKAASLRELEEILLNFS